MKQATVGFLIFMTLRVCNFVTSDVRGHLISQVSRLLFYIHLQTLYFATFIYFSKEPCETRVIKGSQNKGLTKLRNLQYLSNHKVSF